MNYTVRKRHRGSLRSMVNYRQFDIRSGRPRGKYYGERCGFVVALVSGCELDTTLPRHLSKSKSRFPFNDAGEVSIKRA